MLSTLQIENVAVIEKAQIDFTNGFCVLTGETGAGKSILIDSLTAVLGGRTSKELVRHGSGKATVSALFENCSRQVLTRLEELGFPAEDDSVLLHRTISADGRTVCRINGCPANTSVLRQLAVVLVNIHGQQDNHALLDPAAHGGFVDQLLQQPQVLEEYHTAFTQYKELADRRERLQMDESDKARRMDMLRYQIEELSAAQLVSGEYQQLTQRKKAAANSEKIAMALQSALACLEGDDQQQGGVDLIGYAADSMEECGRFVSVNGVEERLRSLSYELEAARDDLRELSRDMVFDPRELAEIEERLDLLYRLSRKYGQDEDAMLTFLQQANEELMGLETSDQQLQLLTEKLQAAQQTAQQQAEALSRARHTAAAWLDQAVGEELQFLNMPNVTFVTRFTPCQLCLDGNEKMEFYISTNPGEEPKPLSKIASGGELSRIMLAILSVLNRQDPVETLIFDEIDAGISGRAALKVGDKLKETASVHQVICITHLAQIAAKATTHYLIEKKVDEKQAVTTVNQLSPSMRLQELARIIGGETVTPASLQTARELME